MSLQADTVNAEALRLEQAEDPADTLGLGVGRLDVVVVVVELGLGVDLGGGLEGEGDVLLAEDVVEQGLAVGTVLVEGLVDDVPGVALALVVAGDVGDVLNDDGPQLIGGPLSGLDPGGELGVPDEGVAAEGLALLASQVGGDVTLGVVEDTALGLSEQPL